MTTNAFIFSWDQLGIDSIVPISQYEFHDQENTIRLLKDQKRINNPAVLKNTNTKKRTE